MAVDVRIEINLVCIDCGKILHWFQEDSLLTELPVLRVQTCPQCSTQHGLPKTASDAEVDAATDEVLRRGEDELLRRDI